MTLDYHCCIFFLNVSRMKLGKFYGMNYYGENLAPFIKIYDHT